MHLQANFGAAHLQDLKHMFAMQVLAATARF
jgi:hypothetical protein